MIHSNNDFLSVILNKLWLTDNFLYFVICFVIFLRSAAETQLLVIMAMHISGIPNITDHERQSKTSLKNFWSNRFQKDDKNLYLDTIQSLTKKNTVLFVSI